MEQGLCLTFAEIGCSSGVVRPPAWGRANAIGGVLLSELAPLVNAQQGIILMLNRLAPA